jgi:hypothetical protein
VLLIGVIRQIFSWRRNVNLISQYRWITTWGSRITWNWKSYSYALSRLGSNSVTGVILNKLHKCTNSTKILQPLRCNTQLLRIPHLIFETRSWSYFTTDGQSVSMSWCQAPLWGPWPDPFFCRKIVLLFVVGRPLWREDGPVICSAICQWSESRRIHNRTVLSHETTGFPFCRLLRLVGITAEVFLPASTRGSCRKN